MQTFYQRVVREVERRFLCLGPEIRAVAEKMLSANTSAALERQIAMLPYWFAKTLGELSFHLPHAFLLELALANLFGWMAYGVYDDFLDGEGQPAQLPAANVCLREVVGIYWALFPAKANFSLTFRVLMDRVDSANSWEQENVKFKIMDGKFLVPGILPNFADISRLADRSIGHALGPLAILSSLGFGRESPEFGQTLSFFEHYLAARQLGDDAHDWWEDLQKGSLNSASVLVLKAFGQPAVNLPADEYYLREVFWLQAVPKILPEISTHLNICRSLLASLDIIKKPARLLQMVDDLESSVQRTKLQQKKIVDLF